VYLHYKFVVVSSISEEGKIIPLYKFGKSLYEDRHMKRNKTNYNNFKKKLKYILKKSNFKLKPY